MVQSFLDRLLGKRKISKKQVVRWFHKFKSSDTSFKDDKERGRSSDLDDQALLSAVVQDDSMIIQLLTEEINVDQSTIIYNLKRT